MLYNTNSLTRNGQLSELGTFVHRIKLGTLYRFGVIVSLIWVNESLWNFSLPRCHCFQLTHLTNNFHFLIYGIIYMFVDVMRKLGACSPFIFTYFAIHSLCRYSRFWHQASAIWCCAIRISNNASVQFQSVEIKIICSQKSVICCQPAVISVSSRIS